MRGESQAPTNPSWLAPSGMILVGGYAASVLPIRAVVDNRAVCPDCFSDANGGGFLLSVMGIVRNSGYPAVIQW